MAMPEPAPARTPEVTHGIAETKPPLELMEHELDYRRTKQWNVFSWSSGILVAITGAMLALQRSEALSKTQRVPITIAVLVLTVFACLWLDYNSKQEKRTAEQVKADTNWNVRGDNPPPGYRGAVILLAVAALFAIWVPV
jgi:uncharacterized membrane protein YkvI